MKKTLLFALASIISAASMAQQFQHLKLTSMCSDDPNTVLRWRVKNQNSYPVTYTWKIVDGGANAPMSSQYPTPFIAQPGDNYFFSPKAATGNNVMVIYVNNVEQNGGRKASGKQQCTTKNFDVFVTCKKQIDPCTYLITFGYYNDNPGLTFTIPHGLDNRFTGGSIIRGESDTVFYPGLYNDAFKIRISCGTTVVWHLKGPFGPKSVNTTAPNQNLCIAPIKPYVNCITPSTSKPGVMEVTFGYEYNDTDTVNIPAGADNVLNNATWGSPITQFLPGKHDNVFTAEFTGTNMEWHLKDYTNNTYNIKAYNQYAGTCVEAVKPYVKCILKNNDGSTTAFFNYNNFNPTAHTILKGSRNYLVGESLPTSLPENFSTGYNDNIFNSTFTGKELKWVLIGPDGVTRYAIANDEYCRVCDASDNISGDRIITNSYPNPAVENLSININTLKTEGQNYIVQVCDMFGKTLARNEYTSNDNNVQLPLSDFKSGLYVVNVFCNDVKETIRVVKQ